MVVAGTMFPRYAIIGYVNLVLPTVDVGVLEQEHRVRSWLFKFPSPILVFVVYGNLLILHVVLNPTIFSFVNTRLHF